jgi:hypothetical protein
MKFRSPLIATLVFSLFTFTLQTIAASPKKHGPDPRSAKLKRSEKKAARRPTKPEQGRLARKSDPPKTIRRSERRRLEAQRRAEAARFEALARQRAAEDALRDRVQALILKDDLTGEDPEIRRVAVNALGNHAGTVVVMNPRTGQVYSIVNQQWGLREGFKPCSTIKLVTGLAGLSEGVIDREDTKAISDNNQVSLTSALAHSKNEYFQTVGGRLGFSKMIAYARQLGLGEKTGINARMKLPEACRNPRAASRSITCLRMATTSRSPPCSSRLWYRRCPTAASYSGRLYRRAQLNSFQARRK